MKIRFAIPTILVVVVMTAISSPVRAQTVTPTTTQDITVNNGIPLTPFPLNPIAPNSYGAEAGGDFNTNPDPRTVNSTPVDALGYVNSGDVPDKTWDLEAFGYSNSANTLTYVGGFNPLVPTFDGGQAYTLGDIFLSTHLIAPGTNSGATGGSNTNYAVGTYQNPGYTYAIHFTGLPTTPANAITNTPATLTYTIYQLTSTAAVLDTVAFNGYENNGLSDPAAFDPSDIGNGTAVAVAGAINLTAYVTPKTNSQINSLLGETGSNALFNTTADQASTATDNYVVSFDLNSILSQLPNGFDVSLTESCGNDLLAGSTSAISFQATPEPKSIYLGFIAAGLFFYFFRLSRRHPKA